MASASLAQACLSTLFRESAAVPDENVAILGPDENENSAVKAPKVCAASQIMSAGGSMLQELTTVARDSVRRRGA